MTSWILAVLTVKSQSQRLVATSTLPDATRHHVSAQEEQAFARAQRAFLRHGLLLSRHARAASPLTPSRWHCDE
ncbi:hypothetical protein [Halomonas sp. 707B3]|uniref:hypothetical protein n=1 Tax=Halomonas sp. 707B3 TaxID=1681043 RepID=UPI00209D420F|nr:hypothetical protein [Halomonas sp. 707B3]MCP1316401.1 hypothetical protein [Halomonas sp. 707B3]